MSDNIRAVAFDAEIRQVKSMADGSVNVTLNLPEYEIPEAQWLLAHLVDAVRVLVQLPD